jgi:hypothetical protein
MAASDFNLSAAFAAAGSKATEAAIKTANMVRANAIRMYEYPAIADSGSSDEFARQGGQAGEIPEKP